MIEKKFEVSKPKCWEWEALNCPSEDKRNCPAYIEKIPCWQLPDFLERLSLGSPCFGNSFSCVQKNCPIYERDREEVLEYLFPKVEPHGQSPWLSAKAGKSRKGNK